MRNEPRGAAGWPTRRLLESTNRGELLPGLPLPGAEESTVIGAVAEEVGTRTGGAEEAHHQGIIEVRLGNSIKTGNEKWSLNLRTYYE